MVHLKFPLGRPIRWGNAIYNTGSSMESLGTLTNIGRLQDTEPKVGHSAYQNFAPHNAEERQYLNKLYQYFFNF